MTALKTISTATVDGAIKLVRLPADTAVRAAPESVASSVGLAVDSADAAIRNAAGSALGDPQLLDEAKRLRAAVAERRRARGLRERASERDAAGEEQAEKARVEAEKRRSLADQQAERKRERARQRRQKKQTEAKKAEGQRKEAARNRAAKRHDDVTEQTQTGRVDALEAKADALSERERALNETDEAQRLKAAASRAKQERKRASAKTRGSGRNGVS